MDDDFQDSSDGISIESCFTYSLEKTISGFDDAEVFAEIKEKYPLLDNSTSDKVMKKIFLEFMEDRPFIKHLTEYYKTNLKDLVRIVAVNFPKLFTSTMYIKKINAMVKKSTFLKRQAHKRIG